MIAAASNINAMASSSGNRKQLPENNGSDDEPSAVAKPNPGTHPSLSSQNVSNRSSDKKKCYNGDARNENPQYSKTTSVELVAATAAASAPPCDSANFDSTTTTTTKTTDLYKHSDPVVKGNMLLLSDESESSAVSSTLTPQGAALRRQKLVCHVDNIRIPPLATTATPNNSVVVTLANNASYTTPPVTKEIFPGKAAVVAMAAASQENDALLAESDLTLESSSGTIKNCSILSNTTTTTTIASMGEVSLGGSLRQQQQHLHLVNAACQAVLAVMRLDPRYIASTRFGNSNIHSDEVLAQDVYLHSMYETFHRQTMSLSSSSLSSNQLLARHNHNFSHCPVTTRRTGRQSNEDESYVKVFCDAVRRQDTSAAVTLAVLDGLYSFVQNGLIVHQHQLDQVATALVQCAFEDTLISTASTHSNNNPVPAVITGLVPPSTEATTNTSTTSGTTTANIPAVAPRLERRSSRIAPQSSAVPTNSLSHSLHDHHSHFPGGSGDDSFDDEPAVLRLLQLIELVVQTDAATNNDMDLSSDLILSLLETCWHVRHKAATASPLLKHAAGSTAQQIVNAVFTTVSTHNVIARCEILRKLSSLLMSPDPDSLPGPKQLLLSHEFATVHVLTLIMSILVSINVSFGTTERSVLEETVVREVIALAIQTTNAAVLRHCLRVCHQLLNVMHLHSMKYELEVLVHAVYLRRLDENSTSSPEEREVVLENLSQLCFNNSCTAASLRHLYWNYDCDFACTNLYEAIVVAFGRTAWECPDTRLEKNRKRSIKTANVDSIDTSRQLGNERDTNSSVATTTTAASSTISTASNKPLLVITISNQSPLNVLNVMALDCIFSVIDMIESNATLKGNATVASGATEPIRENTDDTNQGLVLICSEALSEKAVQSNKQTKNDLFAVACSFNKENPEKGEWLSVAIEKGLLQSITDSKAVAQLLHSLPEVVDKQRLGIYLSRGPDEKFPFQAKIRKSFTAMYNFTGLSFQAALRSFLSKFRLPGEAQCIDRLMEAFSKEYFDQQKAITDFKNSDAVYVLAFSTIMLNTDLHNPTIKTEQRMTKEQFIRNNRGINGGSDLPKDFLADLFDQIKDRALKVRSLSSDVTVKGKHDFLDAWDNVTQKKKGTVISVYVPLRRQGGAISQLDREMFALLSKFCLHSIFGIFSRTWDDSLVVRSLRGLQQIVVLAAHFELDYVINDVLQALLPLGREYIVNCIANDQATATLFDGGTSVETLMHSSVSDYIPGEEDAASAAENDQNIPFGLLCSNDGYEHVDISGSATHRGLLALDASFVLLRQNASRVTSAWPAFIECICVLRDARALPAGLSDLDDFADSSGKVLPLSSFARSSHKRLEAYHKSLADKDATKQKGWFRSFFRKGKIEDQVESDDIEPAFTKGRLSVCARTLLGIADAANVENILQMGSSQLPDATIRTLLDGLDSYPFENDPAGEQHAVFTLELAARALLSNRERAEELFVLFLSKFEKILMKISDTDAHVAAPFVIERVVVTILRSSIHLYENSMVSFDSTSARNVLGNISQKTTFIYSCALNSARRYNC